MTGQVPFSFAPGPGSRMARAGTPVGDQLRDSFTAKALGVLGDARLLWLPKAADTTSHTEASRNARVFTYDATVAARKTVLGSGLALDFDGSDDEADVPDADNLSFGDGAVDEPFSVIALLKPDTVSGIDTILSKYDLTTGSTKREWRLFLNGGAPNFVAYDESAAANVGRSDATALSTSAYSFLAATYDGTAANTGFRVYLDGARVDDTNQSSGTYVAMENTTSLVRLAFEQGASAGQSFVDGKMALVALTAKALTIDEVWALKALINSFFDLAL